MTDAKQSKVYARSCQWSFAIDIRQQEGECQGLEMLFPHTKGTIMLKQCLRLDRQHLRAIQICSVTYAIPWKSGNYIIRARAEFQDVRVSNLRIGDMSRVKLALCNHPHCERALTHNQ